MSSLFYVLSLKWSRRHHGVLSWWGPKNSDYVFRLEDAGQYTEAEIAAAPSYYNNGSSTVAVPVEVVQANAIPASQCRSSYIYRERDGGNLVVRYGHLDAMRRAGAPNGLTSTGRQPARSRSLRAS